MTDDLPEHDPEYMRFVRALGVEMERLMRDEPETPTEWSADGFSRAQAREALQLMGLQSRNDLIEAHERAYESAVAKLAELKAATEQRDAPDPDEAA